ncbi:MAG: arylamine N-acetyltransferase, partial [Coleofasciculus sp. Co-bin14]|nr:arylamine N-acetyltransferase [Coleofasciculus sp. Co-bin14]
LQQRKDEATWQQRYLFTLDSHQLTDFAQTCHYNQTSPESIFTQQRICTIATPKGRITLSDMRLIITEQGTRQERLLDSQDEYKSMLQNYFGINL